MRQNKSRALVPVILLFIVVNSLLVGGRTFLRKWNVDQEVLILGNLLLFIITLVSFIIVKRSLDHTNPHVFIRAAYGSIMIKLFVCIIAAFIYIATHKKELNKPALFSLMGLYLFYTFIEVTALMKLLKTRTNE